MKGYSFKTSDKVISEDLAKKNFPGPAFYNEA